MKKRIALALVVLAALVTAACGPAAASGQAKDPAPAHPSSSALEKSESLVKGSRYASLWHQPGRGYRTLDRAEMRATTVPPRHKPIARCDGQKCRARVFARYRNLHHQWRVLNSNLWALVDALPKCTNDRYDDCSRRDSGLGSVTLDGDGFVAQQRSVFAS